MSEHEQMESKKPVIWHGIEIKFNHRDFIDERRRQMEAACTPDMAAEYAPAWPDLESVRRLIEAATPKQGIGIPLMSGFDLDKLPNFRLLAEEALPALKTMQEREQWMGNLLAVIHRDGGQYLGKHGWQQACEDGEKIVLRMREENDELKERGVTRDELYDIEGKVDYECSVAGPIAVFLYSKGLLIGSPEEEGVAEDSNYE